MLRLFFGYHTTGQLYSSVCNFPSANWSGDHKFYTANMERPQIVDFLTTLIIAEWDTDFSSHDIFNLDYTYKHLTGRTTFLDEMAELDMVPEGMHYTQASAQIYRKIRKHLGFQESRICAFIYGTT